MVELSLYLNINYLDNLEMYFEYTYTPEYAYLFMKTTDCLPYH